MAHLKKFNRSSVGHILQHLDRSASNISNENLDRSLSYKNMIFESPKWLVEGDTPFNKVNNLIQKNKCLNRKDVNVLCDWVITKPKDLDPIYTKKFFEESFKFLSDRYGLQNTIGGYVHMDETTPHMHFAFCPIQNNKFDAKHVVDKKDLQTFHKDLQVHLERVFGFQIHILTDEKEAQTYSIEELKAKTNFNKVKEQLETEIINLNTEVRELKATKKAYDQYKDLMDGSPNAKDIVSKLNRYDCMQRYCPHELESLEYKARSLQKAKSLDNRER